MTPHAHTSVSPSTGGSNRGALTAGAPAAGSEAASTTERICLDGMASNSATDVTASARTAVPSMTPTRTPSGPAYLTIREIQERLRLSKPDSILRAIRRTPNSSDAWADLVRLEGRLHDLPGTTRAMARALALDPRNVGLRQVLAGLATQQYLPNGSATATGTPLPKAGFQPVGGAGPPAFAAPGGP